MCAKKAAASTPKKPAPKTKRKTAAAEVNNERPDSEVALTTSVTSKKAVPAPSAKTKASTSSERTISNHDIGAVAGEIWALLAAKDLQTLAAVKKDVAAPADVVVAAIGWLAREDKLEFATSGKTLKVSLKS